MLKMSRGRHETNQSIVFLPQLLEYNYSLRSDKIDLHRAEIIHSLCLLYLSCLLVLCNSDYNLIQHNKLRIF
jgi:hypothetical protein